MQAESATTTIRLRKDIRSDLERFALDLSRTERRRVTLGEAVDRLLTAWRQPGADPAKPGRPS